MQPLWLHFNLNLHSNEIHKLMWAWVKIKLVYLSYFIVFWLFQQIFAKIVRMLSLAKKSWTQCHANLTEGEVNRGFIKPPVIRFGIKYFNNFTQRKTLLRGIFHSTGSDVHFPSKILREFFIEIRIHYLGEFRKLYAEVCF